MFNGLIAFKYAIYLINPVIYVPMATEQNLVLRAFCNGIRRRCTVIYCGLVDATQEYLSMDLTKEAGMGKYNAKLPTQFI